MYRNPLSVVIFLAAITFIKVVWSKEDGLSRTPPMGWNSWNRFQCNIDCSKDPHNCLSERLIREIADTIVSSGMAAAGYEYVNLDDCWLSNTRDIHGKLQPDPSRFPSGMKSLSNYIHRKGLKFGIYEDCGNLTCAGFPGSEGNESKDIETFVEWEVDYLKLDGCYFDPSLMKEKYKLWSSLLTQSQRPVVFSCSWPAYESFENIDFNYVASICHLWRDWIDIRDSWDSWMNIIDHQILLSPYNGPSHWNDPDMLEIGNGNASLTEYKAHFSLWAILAAPLIAGNDLRTMSEDIIQILTAPEVISVDQDVDGIQGWPVANDSTGMLQVWSKPLHGTGIRAVVLLNRSTRLASITVQWNMIDLRKKWAFVRDLWLRENLGSFYREYTAPVEAHGVVMLKIWEHN